MFFQKITETCNNYKWELIKQEDNNYTIVINTTTELSLLKIHKAYLLQAFLCNLPTNTNDSDKFCQDVLAMSLKRTLKDISLDFPSLPNITINNNNLVLELKFNTTQQDFYDVQVLSTAIKNFLNLQETWQNLITTGSLS